MENLKPNKKSNEFKNGSYEHEGRNFETLEGVAIAAKDIQTGDRAFIYTESGNRYMLRRSRSNDNKILVYDEREGEFNAESGRLLGLHTGRPHIAEIGKPFNAFALATTAAETSNEFTSKPVTRIVIIRGADTAAHSKTHKLSAGSWGRVLAQELGKAVRGQHNRLDGDE